MRITPTNLVDPAARIVRALLPLLATGAAMAFSATIGAAPQSVTPAANLK